MKANDKVRVSICGQSFYLTSEDDPEYLKSIAEKVDVAIGELLKNNLGMTLEQAAILSAINYCDDYEKRLIFEEKQSGEDENLGRTLVQYSKELTRATARIKSLEKELEQMQKAQGRR